MLWPTPAENSEGLGEKHEQENFEFGEKIKRERVKQFFKDRRKRIKMPRGEQRR